MGRLVTSSGRVIRDPMSNEDVLRKMVIALRTYSTALLDLVTKITNAMPVIEENIPAAKIAQQGLKETRPLMRACDPSVRGPNKAAIEWAKNFGAEHHLTWKAREELEKKIAALTGGFV
jgi:hypothetical protein